LAAVDDLSRVVALGVPVPSDGVVEASAITQFEGD
jgi:hypothetical protein